MIEILSSGGPFHFFNFFFFSFAPLLSLVRAKRMWVYIGGDTNVLTELRAVTSQRRKYVIEGGFLPLRINMILN
ncbi:hypothetical protein Fmac_002258 [Flemingia macrophylla]|uniref:Uncharacterized protein n=1 Tax=Flemingia macrophylla TaxID=520843 RepID=A0ABD1NL33_9FABA